MTKAQHDIQALTVEGLEETLLDATGLLVRAEWLLRRLYVVNWENGNDCLMDAKRRAVINDIDEFLNQSELTPTPAEEA